MMRDVERNWLILRKPGRVPQLRGPAPKGPGALARYLREVMEANPDWQPLQPRGEVYSTDWTPADWKSFSEVHGYTPDPDQAPFLLAAAP